MIKVLYDAYTYLKKHSKKVGAQKNPWRTTGFYLLIELNHKLDVL
jgi:hypothetical protein